MCASWPPAALVVLKFGGSSVDGGEKIAGVAELVGARSEPRLVVLSAMGKGTSELQRLAARAAAGDLDGAREDLDALAARHAQALAQVATKEADGGWVRQAIDEEAERVGAELEGIRAAGEVTPRANDAVVSLGELLSSRLLTAALTARGVAAAWLDPRDLVATDACFGVARPDRARIFHQVERQARPLLAAGKVVLTGGYVGRAPSGRTTTMGRESSDLSATLLGGALRASAVEIWTDVDGILTADPRLVPAARLVPTLSYREAGCLARLGAKVIHPDTVAPAAAVGTRVCIRNRFRPEAAGSVIGPAPAAAPLWGIAARETLLSSSSGKVVRARFPVEGSWALATGYRLGSVPLQLKVSRQVLAHVGRTARVLVSVVGRLGELDGGFAPRLRHALRDLDAVEVPGRGIAVSHLLPLGEAREAVERLHRVAFEELALERAG
ncbi:MAG TPA: aspartate kinase [Thermoanaerobaculia bacterium]|jgi:aspartate kinase|nr:aspartate kinase [Thermoanaerobaculia bacterium]